ncbi:hypothetical protein BGZ81_001235, partial [Podila clonocystis]
VCVERNSPQLPVECLDLILDYLRNDFYTLRALLTVNQFFFKAAVSILLRNPFSDWRILQGDAGRVHGKKLASLVIASVLQWQRRRLFQAHPALNPGMSTARALLTAFGLELVEPITSPLLQDALDGVSLTTLDYGQFLGAHMLPSVDIEHFIRPSQFYEPAEGNIPLCDIHGASIVSIGPTYDENEREMLRLLDLRATAYRLDGMDKQYLRKITSKRLAHIFIPCYPESITTISLHACETNPYFRLASKLSVLDTIKLSRENDEMIPEQHLQNLVTFIRMNQASFRRKKPLHLVFDKSWKYSPILVRHLTRKGKTELDYQKPRITLYEAVGNPISINANPCPRFYATCKNIGVDSLESLRDRGRRKDAFAQLAFLQQCHRLKFLEMFVHSPDMFSWAVTRLPDGSVERSEHLLCNLQDVHLYAILSVLNDVMAAFGNTLRHVKVQNYGVPTSTQPADVIYDVRFSRHCKLGDWISPFIRTINIECNVRFGVYVGDFSDCPSLTSLVMSLNGEPIANQAYIAPAWRLPRLITLELKLAAAILFNYDSLDHMPSLEILVLDSGRCWKPPVMIPRLSSYFPPEGSFDSATTASAYMSQAWKDQWHMPNLKTLNLCGIPSAVFRFNWLKALPSLEVLDLDAAVPFWCSSLWSSSSGVVPASLAAMDLQNNSCGIEGVDDSGFDHGMVPLLESKLHKIKLAGRWNLTEIVLARIFGLYAPNLTTLLVSKSRHYQAEIGDCIWRGDLLVRAAVNSSSLRYLMSHYKISEEIKSQLSLVEIAWMDVKKYEYSDQKILYIQGRHYICSPGEIL